jgi:hypothetical protein
LPCGPPNVMKMSSFGAMSEAIGLFPTRPALRDFQRSVHRLRPTNEARRWPGVRSGLPPALRQRICSVRVVHVKSAIITYTSRSMTITLPLQPQEEAKLIAIAQSKGLSTDGLMRLVVEKILTDAPDVSPNKEPTRSSRGILAKYGAAPSAEEIDQNRAEMFANFARD